MKLILTLTFVGVLLISGAVKAEDCTEVKAQCDEIIGAFEKEIEMKDLTIKKLETATVLLQAQRDKAYEIAKDNSNGQALTIITGVAAGCVLAGEKVEVRLGCGIAALAACLLGGCQ